MINTKTRNSMESKTHLDATFYYLLRAIHFRKLVSINCCISKEMFYLTTHSTHFYGYMTLDIIC